MRHLTFPRGEVFIEFGGTRCLPPFSLFPSSLQSPRLDCIFDSSRAWTLQMRRRLAAVAPAIKSPFAEIKKKYLIPFAHAPPLPCLPSALIAPRSVAALIMWILNIYKKLSAKISAKNFINYFYSGDFSFFSTAALEISSLVCESVCVCVLYDFNSICVNSLMAVAVCRCCRHGETRT